MNTTIYTDSSTQSIETDANDGNPTPNPAANDMNPTVQPSHLMTELEYKRDRLVEMLGELIPLLLEKNLCDRELPASVVSAIIRSHRGRLKCRTFKARELVELIQMFDLLVVEHVAVTASKGWDANTGRESGTVSFRPSDNITDSGNCIAGTVAICNKRARKDPEESKEARAERQRKDDLKLAKLMERQKKHLMKLSEAGISTPELFTEDEDLLNYLRTLMPKPNGTVKPAS